MPHLVLSRMPRNVSQAPRRLTPGDARAFGSMAFFPCGTASTLKDTPVLYRIHFPYGTSSTARQRDGAGTVSSAGADNRGFPPDTGKVPIPFNIRNADPLFFPGCREHTEKTGGYGIHYGAPDAGKVLYRIPEAVAQGGFSPDMVRAASCLSGGSLGRGFSPDMGKLPRKEHHAPAEQGPGYGEGTEAASA